MKKLLVIIFVFSIQFINAQDQELARAKRFFDKTYYSEAITLYQKLADERPSQEVIKNLADSYFYTNDLVKAQRYYRLLVKNYRKDLDREYYFRYAQTLKATNSVDEANQYLKEYYALSANTEDVINFEKDLKTLENVSAIGKRFEIKNLAINTPNSEFGAVKYNDNLVFAGVKLKPGLLDKKFKWDNETYLNLVSIPLKNINSADSTVHYFAKELKTGMHESNAVFTKDGKTIYFTRNNSKNGKKKKDEKKISNLQIFKAELVNGKWTNITSLPFNSPNYSVEHPALSADEKVLYFASDMPGSLGSFDIYSVNINKGAFDTPKNLGPEINTNKREQFPFASADNKLYFSSDGHLGYGSLDVFVSEINGSEYGKAVNIGLPLNSNLDDFAFNIDSNTKEGYFASNREGGKGSDDIYQFKEIKDLVVEDCKQFIAGTITDIDTKLVLENATVLLQDSENKTLNTVTTGVDGKFSFTVACETSYKISAFKENYTNASKILTLDKTRDKVNDGSLELRSLEAIKQEEKQIAENKRKQEIIIEENNKKKEALAAIELKEKEKKAKEAAIVAAEVKKTEKVKEILAQEKDVVKDKDRLIIKTDPIYFDYNMWYIRKESKVVLGRVVELMKKYPGMVIEIGSHTDSRGNAKFNEDLSQKRANSTREFIIQSGIDAKRVTAKGYGESVPIIKCKTDDACSEEDHELNRRSEFVIKNL
ncbi:outer membrane protein OmpA-like peptidoglycan-associated protein [Flavobacterium nitrogenifigens]|uniref:Outer membrane protein OmpA-like peptidoglycan-associated protein n=2 Tax=Flavobacterium TaxID=237 RepID=A0A7W7N925_9FLAO|nr:MULTISPECIES: OmpA family protein [Flavobacterium]MBB4803041.1 outer membrane protein OmpA-like peptidoglycan-associated protein [Flavobacterium nitrogenifigens]MBB6387999.1 outer membrane protein OmpA-like peptidoglycan-associated protein [Flavobacterium notoginsengisoli]